ncbi:hypothetical protein LTLLF_168115 [Microtus ochrogaster]|uniref:Uncharacterized protein n=1 Tax=Microtus ochrogaster TaxID=79684 RepID=A0A8J6GBK6_MICOH|nr:hypothetical protein LTLLF_168115 [Microtus ochrogaster]
MSSRTALAPGNDRNSDTSASAWSLPSRKPPPLPAGAPPFPGCRVCPLLASPQPCWARPFAALHVPGSPKRSPCSPPPPQPPSQARPDLAQLSSLPPACRGAGSPCHL